MPGGLAWWLCLLALLLSKGQADVSNDLTEVGDAAEARSGNVSDVLDSNESKDGENSTDKEALVNHIIPNNDTHIDDLRELINQQDREETETITTTTVKDLKDSEKQDAVSKNGDEETSTIADVRRFADDNSFRVSVREIPQQELIFLQNIPGADNTIYCSKEGDLYNAWASNLKCMVCVCQNHYGSLQPVCISCDQCPYIPALPVTTYSPSVTSYTPAPPLPEDTLSCKPLPVNVPFESPLDPCKICICMERINQWGEIEALISCQHNPQCVLPTPSSYPTPVPPRPVCDKFPPNVPFPHPQDGCKICKCVVISSAYGVPEQQITCETNPACITTTFIPSPISTTTSRPLPPQPEFSKCAPLPVETPFQNPLNPCQICVCMEHADLFGRTDVQIRCQESSECVLPQDVLIFPPVVIPTPLPACEQFPENVYFPHPNDNCKICRCSVLNNPYGQPEQFINCFIKPECAVPSIEPQPFTTPEPELITVFPTVIPVIPSTTYRPQPPPPFPSSQPDNVKCAPLPLGTPFQNPLNPCQICVCMEHVDSFGRTDVQIRCQESSECVVPQDVITIPPVVTPTPLPVCEQFPKNVYFPHPNDNCKICKCSVLKSIYGPPEQNINCFIKPECAAVTEIPYSTLEPEPIIIISPSSNELCDQYPVSVVFQHPLDPCKMCKCQHSFKQKRMTCSLKPSCQQPPPEPITIEPPMPSTPTPDISTISCNPLPSGRPFQNPLDPCQVCLCTETVDFYGRPDVNIKCQKNNRCVLPPVPVPIDVATETPLPACSQFPENVEFPHPQEQCLLCKCTVKQSFWGQPEQNIVCYNNPECFISTTIVPITPAPWPSVPPGPLPGPYPHESCKPYTPNKPFQHPWDECQVCVCREDIAYERITIEVNCYTKSSCCVEPPVEITGSSTGPIVISSGSNGFAANSWPSGNFIVPGNSNPMSTPIKNRVEYSGGNLISNENAIAPNSQWFDQGNVVPGDLNSFNGANGIFSRSGNYDMSPGNSQIDTGGSWYAQGGRIKIPDFGYEVSSVVPDLDGNLMLIDGSSNNANVRGWNGNTFNKGVTSSSDERLNEFKSGFDGGYDSGSSSISDKVVGANPSWYFSESENGLRNPQMREKDFFSYINKPKSKQTPSSGNVNVPFGKPRNVIGANGQWRINANSVLPDGYNPPNIINADTAYTGDIYSPEVQFEKGYGGDQDVFNLLQAQRIIIPELKQNANAETFAVKNPKFNTKMRTKSGDPNDQSTDYGDMF